MKFYQYYLSVVAKVGSPGGLLCTGFIAALIAATGSAALAASPITPYGKLPALHSLKLSPDGKHLSSVRPYKGEKILVIQNIEGKGLPPVLIRTSTNPEANNKIGSHHWINNDRLLVFMEGHEFVGRSSDRKLVKISYAIAVSRDASGMMLLPSSKKKSAPRNLDNIVDYLRDDPQNVLVKGRNSSHEGNTYKLNVETGKTTPVVRGTYSTYSYFTDRTGSPRIRYNWDFGKQEGFAFYRRPDSLNWYRLFSDAGTEDYGFLDFTDDPNVLVTTRVNEAGWTELYNYNLTTRTFGPLIKSFVGTEFGGIVIDDVSGEHIGYETADDFHTIEYHHPFFKGITDAVAGALPGQRVRINDYDRARKKFIISASTETDPVTYYLYDTEKGSITGLGSQYPSLEGKPGYKVSKITYTARDGLEIPAYLTLPRTQGPHKTIILPHGGPLARNYMEFDQYAQGLASEGYAVLQPNYRGSTGLGFKHEEAGYSQWGLKMHDDIVDGTRHLIDQGIARADSICIAGWSYGGYAAIRAATLNEDKLFKCAVVGAAVVDVEHWLVLLKAKIGWTDHLAIGDLRGDRKRIREISPIHNIDKVNIPVLVVHGEYDARVGPHEGKKLADALKPTGYLDKYVELEKGDHNMSKEVNRLKFFEEMAAFLNKNL